MRTALSVRRRARLAGPFGKVDRWPRHLAGALIAASLAAGCGESADDGAVEPLREVEESARYGGTAVIGARVPLTTLNPLATTDSEPHQVQKHLLLMTLLTRDVGGELVPYLARSVEIADDSTAVTFRLRDDIRWHDGEPTTARDVAFTFDRAKDPEVPFPNRSWFDLWESAELLDEHTIRFTIEPHAEFLFGWGEMGILPAHILGDTPAPALDTHPYGTTSPVGNGPYRFVERSGSDTWVFEANDEFPAELGGRPYLDRVVYRVVPEPTTLLSELRVGSIHLYWDMPPGQIGQVEAAPDVLVDTRPSRAYTMLIWNSRQPWFGEPLVRQALTMAIDRETILAATRSGLGSVSTGPVGPWHPAHDPDLLPIPYSPDSARALLAAGGWVDADGDDVRERNGTEFRFELLTSPNPIYQDIAIIVERQLAAVGIAAELRTLEPAALGGAITSPERRFDATIIGWEPEPVLDDRDLWACDRIGQPFQFSSYCNVELDQVLDSIPRALNPAVRNRLYRRYNQIIEDDQPFTWIYDEQAADGRRVELQGTTHDARGALAGVTRWWLHPDARGGGR